MEPQATVRHVRMLVGYDGTDFHGSQVQPSKRTVQGELERCVATVAPGTGRLVFAGRTDRGVHAVGQVVSGDVAWTRPVAELRDALNAVGPDDLVVTSVVVAPDAFHARYDARWREYRYRVCVADAPPVLMRRYAWWRRLRPDAELAQAACSRLIGRNGFGTFAGLGRSRIGTPEQRVRTVRNCEWRQTEPQEWAQPNGGSEWHELRITADGFLPQMVRNIVAAIWNVAIGAQQVEWIDQLLAADDRSALGEAAPPHGLVLWQVTYDDDVAVAGTSGLRT